MRWWASLRQAYPNRRPITLAALVLLFCLVVGGALIGAGAATLHLTGTEQFCSSCHTNDAAAEFKDTIHDKNRTGDTPENFSTVLTHTAAPLFTNSDAPT